MLSTICISVLIGMFQAANIAKAKQALALCYEDTTDTTFITKLESFDNRTNVKVFELDLHFQLLLQLPVYSTSAKSLHRVPNHW